MNNDDSVKHVEPGSTSNTPPTSTSGKPVNVVERDLEDRESDTTDLDQSFTPSSIRTREQAEEELRQKIAEIERKVADGN